MNFFSLDNFTNLKVPIIIDETDPEKLKDIVVKISPIFGAVFLKYIKPPECFE